MRPGPAVVGALLAIVCLALPAPAQTLASFHFQVDNDAFDFWLPARRRPDYNYTHGEAVRAVFNAAPQWARGGYAACGIVRHTSIRPSRCIQTFVAVAQKIFTPARDSARPVPGERPYAGLLHADIGRRIIAARHTSALAVTLGTTGHASGAEATQTAFHRLTGQWIPQGWEYQIAGQPVIGMAYGRQYLLTRARLTGGSGVEVTATGEATASNIRSGLNAGLKVRAGYRIPHPWVPDVSSRRGFRAYVVLGTAEEWVARNLLIEGNSRWTTGLVSKRPFVFQSMWGVALGAGDYSIEYRATSHSREYDTSSDWHRWGTISLTRGIP